MKSRRILFIQHGETDKPGLLGDVIEGLGIAMDVVHSYREKVPAELNDYTGLAIGGGAQAAYEEQEYPYLRAECDLVRHAVATERPVLGLCLGAQLMAKALGATVRRHESREIGFFDVALDPIAQYDPVWCGVPTPFVTTHWHGDTFDIPPGGMKLGSSDITPNQLFRYGHSLYGLQFHLEMTPAILDEMVQESREELSRQGFDPDDLLHRGHEHLPRLRETAATVFTRWAEMV